MTDTSIKKTGYLNQDFQIFYNKDTIPPQVDFHYHDFHKILILLQGQVAYTIEGRSYELLPGDIVLVPAGDLHRPLVSETEVYERIIIYVSDAFLSSHSSPDALLSACFQGAHHKGSYVLRKQDFTSSRLGLLAAELKKSVFSTSFAKELYSKLLVLEFLVLLNRQWTAEASFSSSDPRIVRILTYIEHHLSESLEIDQLSQRFHISRSHLMHLFKGETGYGLAQYIQTKRLLMARDLVEDGMPITEACYACGYQNYSTFSRAYQKQFHHAPREDRLHTVVSLSVNPAAKNAEPIKE